jgi:hypothetical protein
VLDSVKKPSRSKQATAREIPDFKINGWYNRTEAPPRRFLILVIARDDKPLERAASEIISISVCVTYRVMGESHERRSCVVRSSELDDDDDVG